MFFFSNYKNCLWSCLFFLFSSLVLGSGFQIWDQNASGTGNYHAGSASKANDASTVFYNPAGMTYLNKQHISFGLNYVMPDIKFKGNVGIGSGHVKPNNFTSRNTRFSSTHSRYPVMIPNIYYTTNVDDDWYAGIGINAPFGTIIRYGKQSWVRYTGIETDIQVINISPAFALRLSPVLSVGLGLDIQKMEEKLGTNINATGGVKLAETYSVNRISSIAPGFHAGILYQIFPDTRLGISYFSAVKHNLRGKSKFTGPLVLPLNNDIADIIATKKIHSGIVLPATTIFSVLHKMNRWDLMGSLNYTQWNRIKNFKFHNIAGISIDGSLSKRITVTAPASLHNTWNIALGANYHINRKLYFQFGIGLDQSPVRHTGRSTRFPDRDRYALSTGFHYQIKPAWSIDAGWTHLIIKKGKIDVIQQTGKMATYTTGHSSGYINTVGVQCSYGF